MTETSSDRPVRTVVSGMSFTECPRWRPDAGDGAGRLWFADFYTHAYYSVAEDGSDLRTEIEVPGQPSGIGWLPDGRVVFVSMRDAAVMRREHDGSVVVHADVSSYVGGHPNDMVVDDEGRCWLGDFGFDLMGGADLATTGLLRVDPDGTVARVAEDLWFPNGSVITDDGTLLVDETFGNRVSAFDVGADGTLGPRRDWAVFGAVPTERAVGPAIGQLDVAPDGCGLDAEGCLWVADAVGGRAIRVREGGEVVDAVSPGTGVYACTLGGADGRTLFLCCAPDFDEHARSAAREGEIRAVVVDVPHAGRP
ncbi:SMP-30/gluconolactonase/LRE family protein [Nocardioides sp. CFH 31398]|uniref:SMP-30/gluconolactonase/LRE family protein n=1 Tax=Nocardioides sp. CFH 31398 TaxID=2919579 RepID=UPI001F05148E|nr:SMP-30/gluconolactonase/LRE family protein [Nocardioides sp. CFH 31398]MCH1865917.1 SMP-30/gluconolactonase/LRE family protein [Nocardioides sp. CFH 31398]